MDSAEITTPHKSSVAKASLNTASGWGVGGGSASQPASQVLQLRSAAASTA